MASEFDVELPAAFLDSAIEDNAATTLGLTPILINLDPEAGEAFIPKATDITFDIATLDPSTGTVNPHATTIYVNGVVAFSNGAFADAYNGANSSYSNPQSDVLRIRIDPIDLFDSEEVVVVRVVTSATGDLGVLDTTYQFTIEDYLGPRIVTVEATDLDRVRVTFNEIVDQPSALLASNWLLDRMGDFVTPIVWAQVTSVEPSAAVGLTTVELVTDIPLTPGGTYQLTVSNVLDAFANPIIAPYNVMTFQGWQPAQPPGRDFSLYKKFADINTSEDTTLDLLRFVGVLQEVANLLLYDIDNWVSILDPDTAPEAFVDIMLEDLGNPFAFDLTEVDKRRLANVLVAMYQLKGTGVGIVNVVRFFLSQEVTIFAYNTFDGWILGESELGVDTILGSSIQKNLYTFDVQSPVPLDDTTRVRLSQIVNYMKPAHTHFANLVEPVVQTTGFDHLILGESQLGLNWILH